MYIYSHSTASPRLTRGRHRRAEHVQQVLVCALFIVTQELDSQFTEVYLLRDGVDVGLVARTRLHEHVLSVCCGEPKQGLLPWNMW